VTLDRDDQPKETRRRTCPPAEDARRIRPGHGMVRTALMIGGLGQLAHAAGPGRA
jgi:hypothetical protein